MNRKIWTIVILLFLIAIGFLLGILLPKSYGCTKMGCSCREAQVEIPCNQCSSVDYIFVTGIINVVKGCSAQEIIICDKGQKAETRYDTKADSCRLVFSMFWIPLNR